MLNKYSRLIVVLGVVCVSGCAADLTKYIYSERIPIDQVNVLKNTILKEGYERVGSEDFISKGAVRTNYHKDISTQTIKKRIHIALNYKVTDSPTERYRKIVVWVSNMAGDDATPEMKIEINRMADVLYRELAEIAGEENVFRSWVKPREKSVKYNPTPPQLRWWEHR